MSTEETSASVPEDSKSEKIVGPDGVERTKNEHKKYMKKLEKEKKKQEHKAKDKAEKGETTQESQ